MDPEWLRMSNSGGMWVIAFIFAGNALVASYLFYRLVQKTGRRMKMKEEVMHEALKASFITSLGPAMGAFVGLTVMVLALGGAYAFARESAAVGSIMYELIAARFGAEAAGVPLTREGMTVAAVAQEVAGVREGSQEGEVISTLAVVATQVMLTLATLCGAIFVTIIVKFLPKGFIAAFDWLLPSIWGAIVVQFGLRKWPYAVVAILVSIYIVIYSPLPGWSHVPIIVFFMAVLGLQLYSKKIWLIAGGEKKDTGEKEGQPKTV